MSEKGVVGILGASAGEVHAGEDGVHAWKVVGRSSFGVGEMVASDWAMRRVLYHLRGGRVYSWGCDGYGVGGGGVILDPRGRYS
jgi:hypothetical protein